MRYSQLKERSLPTGLLPENDFVAVAEDVRSLWNVGSIFRTADGAGIKALYLAGITGTPPRKEIAKTSLGAEDSVPWSYVRTTTELIPHLKNAGMFILGLEYCRALPGYPDSIPLREALAEQLIPRRVCVIVGNEVTGLTAETMSACDRLCHLPMRGLKESLNVAVAFGIAAYMLGDQRANC